MRSRPKLLRGKKFHMIEYLEKSKLTLYVFSSIPDGPESGFFFTIPANQDLSRSRQHPILDCRVWLAGSAIFSQPELGLECDAIISKSKIYQDHASYCAVTHE